MTVWAAVGDAAEKILGGGYCGALKFVIALAFVIVLGCGLWRRFWEGKPGAAPRGKETFPRVS
jgi:hypothetical protein